MNELMAIENVLKSDLGIFTVNIPKEIEEILRRLAPSILKRKELIKKYQVESDPIKKMALDKVYTKLNRDIMEGITRVKEQLGTLKK